MPNAQKPGRDRIPPADAYHRPRGEDGEVRAFALALDPKAFRQEDYNGFAPVKIKATLAAADTSTDNSLPAAGAQGATREKEADNGKQENG